ncbi:MAG: hypothetical protein D6758_09670 [Gammaproteobacteria bacterium]|nr:MAG: hypothetical protein D6758_09670 [Gammaproteobacteria bacterium]
MVNRAAHYTRHVVMGLVWVLASAPAASDPVTESGRAGSASRHLNAGAFQDAVLHYRASKFFISADSRVTQRWLDPELAARQLYPAGNGQANAGLAPQGPVAYMGVESDVIGRKTLAEAWLRPDGEVLQRTSIRLNHKHRARLYRFTPERVWSLKRYPVSEAEQSQPWPMWSRTESEWFDLPDHPRPLTRGEGLFYLAVTARLNQSGDRWHGTLFDSDGLMDLTLEVAGKTRVSVDFEEAGSGAAQRVDQSLPVLRIQARVTPRDAAVDARNFSFLGLKGGVTLYVDPVRHLIVQLEGKADVLGEVTIRLQQVQWRHNPVQVPE